VAPDEVEEPDEEEEFGRAIGRYGGGNSGGCDDATRRVRGQSVTGMVEVAWMVNGLPAVRFL
jgi:hypothetical protein